MSNETSKVIYKQLLKALKARRWRARRLAEELGVGAPKLTKLKYGAGLEFEIGVAICDKLDIPPSYLLDPDAEVPSGRTPEEKIIHNAVFGPQGIGFTEAVDRLLVPGDPSKLAPAQKEKPRQPKPLGATIKRGKSTNRDIQSEEE